MNYRIIVFPKFAKELKRLSKKYRSIKQDYAKLLNELYANPTLGVDLGGGVRKIRMAIGSKNRGKSHGARVITFTYQLDEENGVINLLYIYDKSERESLTAAEIDELLNEIGW
ncbi:MAG: type II toxin-antitoxin system RelE/ParE family toxin [Prevotellaceae bacterium]|jgi:mRNA-degrading endonuclease RelE of RelBE toxin-antitoxin system|nr:type II toxin-antitoxin system RelE/ParE family toxin [Prevotellaceae bacterium]